jgi:hypothetical protein
MKFRLDYIALPLFLLTLGYNCWHWGSAVELKDIGPVIADRAEREALLVETYLVIGRAAIGMADAHARAAESAEATFGPAREVLLAQPELAIEHLLSQSVSPAQSRLRTTHWLCPLALLLFGIGWLMRPKKIQTVTIGQRR